MLKNMVFFSYATADRAVVDKYVDAFRCAGIEVWIDHEQIQYGDSLPERLEEAVNLCRHSVIFQSQTYQQNVWTQKERQLLVYMQVESRRAGSEERTVFVVRLDGAELPPFLKYRVWFQSGDPKSLVAAVITRFGKTNQVQTSRREELGQAHAPRREVKLQLFLNELEGPALEMLAQQLVGKFSDLPSTPKPGQIEVQISGHGLLECECLPLQAASIAIDELKGLQRRADTHRHHIRRLQDRLTKRGLGIFESSFEIDLGDQLEQLELLRFGKYGIKYYLSQVILRVWSVG